jgi:hypothetical protein
MPFFRRKLGKIAENGDHNIDPSGHPVKSLRLGDVEAFGSFFQNISGNTI